MNVQSAGYDYIDITNIDKAKLLIALFNNAINEGIFISVKKTLTIEEDEQFKNDGIFIGNKKILKYEEAQRLLNKYKNFNYLYGRTIKIDLSNNRLDPFLYNRFNGKNKVQEIVNKLRMI